jgi:hypothetical protein
VNPYDTCEGIEHRHLNRTDLTPLGVLLQTSAVLVTDLLDVSGHSGAGTFLSNLHCVRAGRGYGPAVTAVGVTADDLGAAMRGQPRDGCRMTGRAMGRSPPNHRRQPERSHRTGPRGRRSRQLPASVDCAPCWWRVGQGRYARARWPVTDQTTHRQVDDHRTPGGGGIGKVPLITAVDTMRGSATSRAVHHAVIPAWVTMPSR